MDDTAATGTGSEVASGTPGEPRVCTRCGSAASPTAKFCGECGWRLHPLSPTAEVRKVVTLLFCDLVGSTALGERLDPETFRSVQLKYFNTCEAVLHRHTGAIEKFIGDAVLCGFGIPVAHEDDARRACRAALELVAGVEALNVELEAEWSIRLSVRIGVNTGVVAVGELGHGQLGASGDAVNTAARLEQAAGPGEILIGATTRELIGDEGVCVPVPPLELKGKGEGIPAWRLIDMVVDDRVGFAGSPPRELVGRAEELQRVESWLADSGRSAGLCLIIGEPGIGKSRVVSELVSRTSRQAHWGRCPPYGEEITYRLLADWLDSLGDETVERAVGDELAERLRFATERSDTPATRTQIEEAARVLFMNVGETSDILLVAEDVHWAEASMRDLLVLLARIPGVSVVATGRADVRDVTRALASETADMSLMLNALDRDAATSLLGATAEGLDATTRDRIVADAGGNPLMILQLGLHVAEGGEPGELPPGLEAVLQARVERLSAEERSVAERGAIMGREFWDSAVAALAPEAAPPSSAIALLGQRNLVVKGRADGAPGNASPTLSRVFSAAAEPFSFTHALIRDRVYESTPKLRRADLHERLGELLEQSGAVDELVAFHFERASRLRSELVPREGKQLAARAATHLERAGDRALTRRDGEAARALLTRAAALLDDNAPARQRITASLAGSDLVRSSELVPGDVIGGYRVRAVAGRGGMGVVYRANDLSLGREVALKVIASELAADPRFRQRFARESRIAAQLEHPNVVPVYSAGEESGRLFIAMRFVNGTDLQHLLVEGALTPDRTVRIVVQVAEALDAAHARGLVHRDVKPANVLVASVGGSEQAYLTDFGLSRDAAAGDGLTKTGQWVGTLAYVAPEQIRGEPVDGRADIYALGAVLYQCLTGRPPFAVDSELEALAAHLDAPPPRPSVLGAPRRFDAVVERAMRKDPRRRFRSAGDVARAAVAAADGRRARLTERSVATGAASAVDVGRARGRRSGRRAAVAGVGAGVLFAGLVGILALATGMLSSEPGFPNPAGRIVGSPVSLPYDPDHLAAADGHVWALASEGNRLMRFDTETQKVDLFTAGVDLGGGAYADVEAVAGAVWIAHAIPDVGGVDHVDPATGEAVQHVAFPLAAAVDASETAVWAVAPAKSEGSGRLVRIDPVRNRIVGRAVSVGRDPVDVAVGDAAIWVSNRGDDSVWRMDPRTHVVIARIPVGDGPAALALTPNTVWVANLADRTLMRIDAATNRVQGAPVSLGKEIQDLVASEHALWVSAADGTVTRLDPENGEVVGSPLTPASPPLALAVHGGDIWVGSSSDQTLTRIEEGTS